MREALTGGTLKVSEEEVNGYPKDMRRVAE
jgi:hypothetical protein